MSTDVFDSRVRLDIYSHFVRVSNFNALVREALKSYCASHLTEWELKWNGRFMERKMSRVYVSAHADRRVFRFHRNQLDQIYRVLEQVGIGKSHINAVEHALFTPSKVTFRRNPKDPRTPRGEQPKVISYLTDPPHPGYAPSKMVELQTGFGKSVVSLWSVNELKHRTVLIIKPMYIKKWIIDLKEAFLFRKGELLVIQGSKDLANLIALAKSGELKAKFIVISVNTFRNYLSAWEASNGYDEAFGCNPEEFYETLDVGIKMVDEAHQEFHTVYRQDLFSHVPLTISLSATMESDQAFMNGLYETAWPLPTRSPRIEYRKYIKVFNVWYNIDADPQYIRCTDFMKRYSHVLLEQWIMKSKPRLARYYEMIEDIMRTIYFDTAKPKQKAIIFCATKEMCTFVKTQMEMAFPGKKVGRYNAEDDYSVLMTSDVTVTTLKSAGTAVDVPDLKVCLCTIAVSNKQANEQAVGRLRELKNWPGENPEFYFLSSHQIEKHRAYAMEKTQKLDGKVLSYEQIESSYRI